MECPGGFICNEPDPEINYDPNFVNSAINY